MRHGERIRPDVVSWFRGLVAADYRKCLMSQGYPKGITVARKIGGGETEMRVSLTHAAVLISGGFLTVLPAAADTFVFSTGNVTNLIATASRPASAGKFEIESADDCGSTTFIPN